MLNFKHPNTNISPNQKQSRVFELQLKILQQRSISVPYRRGHLCDTSLGKTKASVQPKLPQT